MRRSLACLSLLLVLTACGRAASDGEPTQGTDEGPAPYRTASPSLTPSVLPALTQVFRPTSTPLIYTVVTGDTLGAIAQRFGITLAALMAANPNVTPTALSVGTTLVIPAGDQASGEPTPTPAPLPVLQARCWPEASGGLWCFALLRNEYSEVLENLSAQFTLLAPGGGELASQTAFGMLDILPPGEAMPLAAHFPGPLDAGAQPRVQLLTSIRLLPGDTRYLPVLLENTLVDVAHSGRTAQVSGRVVLTGSGSAATLWVLATAYDSAGDVVGVRRWESPSTLTAAQPAAFDFLVSSLGPAIASVTFLAEARP
jgi:murein DD-endopeptidase MepM/ murein hydrolase activator NlpD